MTEPGSSLASARVLVTGAGGFLGRAIVERLVEQGACVRGFARRTYPELETLGVEWVRGDLTDKEAVGRACAGRDVVFHVAAKAGVWGAYAEYHRPNVVGTANVLAGCRKHNVPHLVYTSSPSVVFDGRPMEGVDESAPYPARHCGHYSATKAIAERSVLAADGADLATIALRPHLIWGPRDNHIVPRIIAKGRAGKLRIVGPGDNKVDTIYIDNAADAHLLAADALFNNPNARGRAYFLSQEEPVVIWEIINGILAAAGLPPVTRRVPHWMARLAGAVMEGVYGALRLPGEPPMTRFVADELAMSHWFDISAAKRELGYQPRVSIREGLRRLSVWLKSGEPYADVAAGAAIR